MSATDTTEAKDDGVNVKPIVLDTGCAGVGADGPPISAEVRASAVVNWAAIEELQFVDLSARAWVTQRVTEFLGEPEQSLIRFIVSKLHSRCSPADLLAELRVILDTDAEPFVKQLWQILISASSEQR